MCGLWPTLSPLGTVTRPCCQRNHYTVNHYKESEAYISLGFESKKKKGSDNWRGDKLFPNVRRLGETSYYLSNNLGITAIYQRETFILIKSTRAISSNLEISRSNCRHGNPKRHKNSDLGKRRLLVGDNLAVRRHPFCCHPSGHVYGRTRSYISLLTSLSSPDRPQVAEARGCWHCSGATISRAQGLLWWATPYKVINVAIRSTWFFFLYLSQICLSLPGAVSCALYMKVDANNKASRRFHAKSIASIC